MRFEEYPLKKSVFEGLKKFFKDNVQLGQSDTYRIECVQGARLPGLTLIRYCVDDGVTDSGRQKVKRIFILSSDNAMDGCARIISIFPNDADGNISIATDSVTYTFTSVADEISFVRDRCYDDILMQLILLDSVDPGNEASISLIRDIVRMISGKG